MSEKTLTIIDDDETPLGDPDPAGSAEPGKAPASEAIATDEELKALQKANNELSEQVKRTAAEFKNFQRRQEEEQKRVKVRLREEILATMLPILDHIERTVAAAKQGGDNAFQALLQGIELIDKDVRKIFEDHGLTDIAALNEIFDPALHQAVMMEESDTIADQTIVAELQKGYKLDDRVIRPSMVKVSRNYSQ